MEYALIEIDGHRAVLLSGRFTYDDGPRFHAMLADWDFAERPVVRLDLRFLTFLDSAAIGMLFLLANRCRDAGGHVIAHGTPPRIVDTLRRVAFDPYVEFR